MEPDPLFERLQRALLPDYRLEHELGSGGMGRVYRAHDVTLSAPVAVKTLRPELATANAAEAFLREAHLMARVRHPHIVTIFHAGTDPGLPYYIMELVEGPTLEQRLAQGPLRLSDAVKVGRDLLDCLETVHRGGIVHRDIKPSNVFLVGDPPRGLLADFGIARAPSPTSYGEGTPGYQAPEQRSGGPVTPATDLYATGAVIYEAITARRFPPPDQKPSWKGIPWNVARALHRATRHDPAKRWPDARAFRHALWRTRVFWYLVRAAMLAIGGIIVGAGAVVGIAAWRGNVRPGAIKVALPRFDYVGPAPQRPIADSLVELLRDELRSHPDFRVSASGWWLFRSTPSLVIRGRAAIADGDLQVQLSDVRMRGSGIAMSDVHVPIAAWRTLRDSLTYRILLAVWDAQSPLAASLPRAALPRTPLGLARFLDAEQLVSRGQWENAYVAYSQAETTDPTCWLCAWRLSEAERWLGREHDPARMRRYLSHVDSFPPWYQSLLRAAQVPVAARLDTLQRETDRWQDFFLGYLLLGDELFHRGPLVGRRRAEAIPALEAAARRRPDFAPAWEHLAWVDIAEGDSAGAARALNALDRRNVGDDPFALTLRALLGLGFAWRFLPEPVAREYTIRAMKDPIAGASPDLAAGPRMLASFDAPRGEVVFGELLAAKPARDLQRSGIIAQMLGSLALGMPSRARALAEQLAGMTSEAEIRLFATELDATLALLDPAALGADTQRSASIVWPVAMRDRSLWLSRLVDRGNRAALLAFINTRDVDSTARTVDPFFRTVARMLRAEQSAAQGDIEGARRELLWHEHSDLVGLPVGLPQAAEVDWAFGTLARWRLARLLSAAGNRAEACDAYRAVARLWGAGEPVYRARADTARLRIHELCQ